jgi:hypothetical protein
MKLSGQGSQQSYIQFIIDLMQNDCRGSRPFLLLGAAGSANMWAAIFAVVGVTLLTVFNALRVLNVKNI